MLYALTQRTADGLKALLADGGGVGGRAASGSSARGTTWVKVTGAAVSGWYPGVVSLADGGSLADGTAAVRVQQADGTAMVSGQRYLCTRAGDHADGTPQFHAVGSKLLSTTLTVYRYTCSGGSLFETATTYTVTGRDLSIS